jgi:hypothetical protein
MGPAMAAPAPMGAVAPPPGFDGAALERRSASMSAAESMRLPGKSRAPLLALLLVDVGLVVAGGLLLRAGLAGPAAASPAAASPASGEGSGGSRGAADEAAPMAARAAADRGGGTGASSQAVASASGEGGAGADGEAAKAAAKGGTAAPAAREEPAADAADDGVAKPPGEAAKADAGGAASNQLLPDGAAEPQPDQSSDKAPDKASNKKSDKGKRPSLGRPGGGEGPVDPYAPPPAPAPAGDDVVRAQLLKAFAKAQPRFDDCYHVVAGGVGAPEVTVSFQVLADGSLGGSRVLSQTAPMLANCVIAELGRIRIKAGGSSELIRRIKFQAKKDR